MNFFTNTAKQDRDYFIALAQEKLGTAASRCFSDYELAAFGMDIDAYEVEQTLSVLKVA